MTAITASARRMAATILVACGLALSITACAPQSEHDSPSSSGANEPAPSPTSPTEFAWSQDSASATCHETDVASFDDAACAASQHSNLKDKCLTCHDDIAGLEDAHKNVTLDSKKKKATLKKTEVSEAVCLTCHDKAELAEATAASTALTDKNGLTVNPHDLPVNDDHAASDTTCSSCHKLHASESATETAPGVCRNCHHADVYECNTCHAEK